jgi:hypothetical protein
MIYFKIKATTTVTAHSRNGLLAVWRLYGHTGLIGAFKCSAQLTSSQLRRLPAGLRDKLVGE